MNITEKVTGKSWFTTQMPQHFFYLFIIVMPPYTYFQTGKRNYDKYISYIQIDMGMLIPGSLNFSLIKDISLWGGGNLFNPHSTWFLLDSFELLKQKQGGYHWFRKTVE